MHRSGEATLDAPIPQAWGRNVTLCYGDYPGASNSGLGRWRGQLVGLDYALEGGAFVRAITEGLALGEAAAAEANLGASAQTVGVAFLVNYFDFAVNQQR